ncbi:hypothetical protein BX600DRAFT_509921 [Xylariales sp. PMI_506]|nr:hypothetical protein BX600DRAFT_509921 [Xylariales sp. PMI_506]
MADTQDLASRPPSPLRRQRACQPCSKAKARCNFQGNDISGGCDRCRRIKIDCTPQTTKVLRRPRQLKPSSGRISSSPDQHVDRITSLLAATSGNFLSPSDTNDHTGDESSLDTLPSLAGSDYIDRNSFQAFGLNTYGQAVHQFGNQPFSLPHTPSYPRTGALSYSPTGPGFGLTWSQAEQAISDFKIKYVPEFPFVTLGHDVFAEQLYLEKPLLFRVVMLVAAPITLEKQRDIKRSVSSYIGRHMLVLEERNLDLLQGLLVFIAWGNHNFYLDRQITHLIHLALGFAHNLAITRFPLTTRQKVKQAVDPQDVEEAMRGRGYTTVAETFHALEEMRAFLGCYYLFSVNSSQFCRQDSLKNEYVEFCLNYIAHSTDYWTDSNLVKLFRLQQAVDRISEVFVAHSNPVRDEAFTYILTDEMRPIRSQIDKIFETFDSEQVQYASFWLHYNHALVRLYEPATWIPTPPVAGQDSFCQCQCLLYCLRAAESFFNALLTSSPEELLSRSFVSSAELVDVLVTTSRLLLLETTDWDLEAARRTLDLPSIMDQMMAMFTSASLLRKQRALESGAGPEDNPDVEKEDPFIKYVNKVKWIKSWFQGRLVAKGVLVPQEQDQTLLDLWSRDDNSGNQFWMGLLGNNSWNLFEF